MSKENPRIHVTNTKPKSHGRLSRTKTKKRSTRRQSPLHEASALHIPSVPVLTAGHIAALQNGENIPDGTYRVGRVTLEVRGGSILVRAWAYEFVVEFPKEKMTPSQAVLVLLEYIRSWVTGGEKKQQERRHPSWSAQGDAGLEVARTAGTIFISGDPHQVIDALGALLAPR